MSRTRSHAVTTAIAVAISCLPAALACCGGGDPPALLVSADGKFRVSFIGEGKWIETEGRQQMEAALARLPQIDLVYAHNDPMAHGAALAARQQNRTGIRFVGVDGLAHEGRRYVQDGLLDATFEYPTCAAAALDLALLACRGIATPGAQSPEVAAKRAYLVGTCAFTRDNPAGEQRPGPADLALLMLRRENAAKLEAGTGAAVKIGMAQCNDAEPWREAMREDMKAWAKAHPFVQFDYRDAANDTQKQRDIVADFTAQGFDAIVVSPKESLALAQVCKEAMAKGIKVIVLDRELGSDDFTCFVGGDNVQIGRMVGERIRQLLPQGGAIVELQGLMTSSPAQERHRGFVEALQLAAPH